MLHNIFLLRPCYEARFDVANAIVVSDLAFTKVVHIHSLTLSGALARAFIPIDVGDVGLFAAMAMDMVLTVGIPAHHDD